MRKESNAAQLSLCHPMLITPHDRMSSLPYWQRTSPRHAGEKLIALVDRYRDNRNGLRSAATAAWQSIVRDHNGPIPKYVREILAK